MTVLDLDERTIGDTIGRLLGTRADHPRENARGQIIVDIGARECYSYGRHFPLFRYVPRTYRIQIDGEWLDMRRPSALFVLNGDRWNGGGGWHPSRTPEHQNIVRRLVEASGVASIVLPFSALTGAGIDIDSIVPLEVTADSWFDETVTVERLADVPKWRRTNTVRAAGPVPQYGYDPNLSVDVPIHPDSDGRYSWTENRHRLGESLFTATRTIAEPSRPAEPFEENRHTARETVRLGVFQDSYWHMSCEPNGHGPHAAGPSGACIHCAAPLFARVWWRKRARYLSAFDYQERAPLYFLCEVPRTGHPTVDGALDSLAPRAVHAARLAERDVRRQGDVFFIGTDQSRESLEQRGATFARLTQWTRDAKPKSGELGFVAPNRQREKRLARLETAYARRLWRQEWRALQDRATAARIPDPLQREANRAAWLEMLARHTAQRLAADHAGVPYDSDVSLACENRHCGADVGEPCREFAVDGIGRRYRCDGGRALNRRLSYQQSRELDELRRQSRREPFADIQPTTAKGTRPRFRKLRADRERAIETANRELRRAILTGEPPNRYGIGGGRGYRETVTDYRRRYHRTAVRLARENLARALQPAADNAGNQTARQTRDIYRQRYGANAVALWNRCKADAQRRYRPETVAGTERARRYRETLRRHLMIYGTAHSATEVARVNGAVYVCGTVRHVTELEPNRRGGPDHRPLPLADGIWYLAVRNTVPRQTVSRRRRRGGRRTVSG